MKKILSNLRDTIIAGLLFLLPLLILFVLISKVWGLLTGFGTRMANVFGIKSIIGVPSGTAVATISILILCILCGYLVRISLFRQFRNWIDEKFAKHLPGYGVYREMAMNKLEKKEELLPYESVVLLEAEDAHKPAFLMEKTGKGDAVVFVPHAGNVKEGTILIIPDEKYRVLEDADLKQWKVAFSNIGIGITAALQGKQQ